MTKANLIAENQHLKSENTAIKAELAQLKRLIFGSKSERFVPTSADQQLSLDLEGISAAEVTPTVKETVSYTRRKPAKKQPKRQPLPEHLPRVTVVIEPAQDVSGYRKIGETITEELDYQPAIFQVLRYVRPKYVCPPSTEETPTTSPPIIIAPLPSRPIEKGIPSAGLLAHILISKFIDHLPYYRQIQQFQRIGVAIKAPTINGWVSKCCALLGVLYDKMCQQHFQQTYLQADETRIQVITPEKSARRNNGKGKTHRGYFWVYYAPLVNNVVFIYDAGRGRKYPAEHLQSFRGTLQTDGLSVYDAFDHHPEITLTACMAHVRRKFVDARSNDAATAEHALGFIQQLYAVERTAREEQYTDQQRYELRQQVAAPLMEKLHDWLEEQHLQVLPKSPIGQAIHYARHRWKYLRRYLEDGRVEIDNNLVENAIRPVAIGRKNYMFAGSEEGAKWAAILYTLLGSALRHGLEPWAYLKDVLTLIADCPINQVHLLLPENWKQQNTQA